VKSSGCSMVVERFASVEESVEFVDVACRNPTKLGLHIVSWPKPWNGRLHAGNRMHEPEEYVKHTVLTRINPVGLIDN